MSKVMAYVHDYDLVRDLMKELREDEQVKLLAITVLPQDTMVFHALNVDVFLLDCTQDQETAIQFAKQVLADECLHIRIVYLFQTMDQTTMEYIMKQDKQASFLCLPCSIDQIIRELVKQGREHKEVRTSQSNEEGYVSSIIQSMGIPVHLKGYCYVKTSAMLLYRCHGEMLTMKQLYKETARIHSTTITRVEKAIRDAIDHAYRVDQERMQIRNHKPTNSEVVHLVYERMLLREDGKQEVTI